MMAAVRRQVRAMLTDAGYRKVTAVIEGGATRPDSTRAALAAIAATAPGGGARQRAPARTARYHAKDCGVLLHDAARPLVEPRIIADCVAALRVHDTAGVAVPASDTMVVTDNGVMQSMPRRETLLRCQTPQCFRLPVIIRAPSWPRPNPISPPPTTAAWYSVTCRTSTCTSCRAASATSRSPTRRTSPSPR